MMFPIQHSLYLMQMPTAERHPNVISIRFSHSAAALPVPPPTDFAAVFALCPNRAERAFLVGAIWKSNLCSFSRCLLLLRAGPVRWERANLTWITPSAYENVNKMWPSAMTVDKREWRCAAVTSEWERVCRSGISACQVCTQAFRCVRKRGMAGQRGGCWRGWMDDGEHLFHAPFAAAGLFIRPSRCCHFACLTRSATSPADGSLYEHSAFTLRLHLDTMHGHLLKRCSAWEPPWCIERAFNNPLSGHPAVSAVACLTETSDLFQETSAGRQKQKKEKNKCGNVVSCCSRPLQMVPLCRQVPSSPPIACCFLQQTAS